MRKSIVFEKNCLCVSCVAIAFAQNNQWVNFSNTACMTAQSNAEMGMGNVNPYNVIGACAMGDTINVTTASLFSSVAPVPNRRSPASFSRINWAADWGAITAQLKTLQCDLSCVSACLAEQYFNDPSVRLAIHASSTVPVWQLCSAFAYKRVKSVIPLYPALIAKYRVLIFNGDHDSVVPVTDNIAWTAQLFANKTIFPQKAELLSWSPWLFNNGQVGGYLTVFTSNFMFATVRGAGHMVPQTQPQAALSLFAQFVCVGHEQACAAPAVSPTGGPTASPASLPTNCAVWFTQRGAVITLVVGGVVLLSALVGLGYLCMRLRNGMGSRRDWADDDAGRAFHQLS